MTLFVRERGLPGLYLPIGVRREPFKLASAGQRPIQIRFATRHRNHRGELVPGRPYMLEFYAYQTVGPCIGHVGGLARADFA